MRLVVGMGDDVVGRASDGSSLGEDGYFSKMSGDSAEVAGCGCDSSSECESGFLGTCDAYI